MPNPVWPLALPQGQLLDGLQENAPNRMIRTQVDVGPMKTRPRWTAGIRTFVIGVGATDGLTSQQVDDLLTFHRFSCLGGQQPFDWINPRTGANATFRFKSPPKITPLGSDMWRATLELEVLPDWAVFQLPQSLPTPLPPPPFGGPGPVEEPPPPPPPPPPPRIGLGLVGVWVFDSESGGAGRVQNQVSELAADDAVLFGGGSVAGGYLTAADGFQGAVVGPPLTAPLKPQSFSVITEVKFLADGGGINPSGLIVHMVTQVIQDIWAIYRPMAGTFAMDNDAITLGLRFSNVTKQNAITPLDYSQETRFILGFSFDHTNTNMRAFINGVSVGEINPAGLPMSPSAVITYSDDARILWGRVDYLTYWYTQAGIYWTYYWARPLTDLEHQRVAVNPLVIFPIGVA